MFHFTFNIHNHVDLEKLKKEIMQELDQLKEQVGILNTKADQLQTSLDAEQAQVKALLDNNASVQQELNNKINDLTTQLNNAAKPEDILAVVNDVKAISDKIDTTRVDLEGTIPEETQPQS